MVPSSAGAYEPPLWVAACAMLVLTWLVARQLMQTHPPVDIQASSDATGWRVCVEVVLLSVTSDGELAYRILTAPLPSGTDPDAAALAVSGLDRQDRPPGCVSHATSWRAVSPAELVLTYTALADSATAARASAEPASRLTAPSVVCSEDPLRPTPFGLHAHHVAAHGARHLAYLACTDPVVARCAEEAPSIWRLISETASAPVAPHRYAHIQADPSTATSPVDAARTRRVTKASQAGKPSRGLDI